MPDEPTAFPELPIAGVRRERADAAANRYRILEAARQILREQGVAGLTMDAVAAEAGVGKGTVFRRFGDRAGLTQALLDDHMRAFQDAFLSGPPPLGPGAPAAERLEAFVLELVRTHSTDLELALAAESRPGQAPPGVYGILLTHLRALLREIDPTVDGDLVGAQLLGAISPPVLHRLRERGAADLDEQLRRATLVLLRGVTAPRR